MVKEANEAAAEYLHSNKQDCVPNDEEASTSMPNNVTDSTFSLNLRQGNWIALKQVDEFSRNEDVGLASESTNSTNMSDNHAECVSNEPEFLRESCQQQEQVSESANNSLSQKKSDEEEAELSFGEAQREQDPSVHEDILQDYSDLENPFGEAYITKTSSKRKQALRMRERPVLAIGRNNIVTGVAKTVKTHFKKHHLAIVNIKGRAEGTSVQEVIFELYVAAAGASQIHEFKNYYMVFSHISFGQQATGAVLVVREPNKVILYRGWREREMPPGKLKDVRKG